jgi:hypothetical protein
MLADKGRGTRRRRATAGASQSRFPAIQSTIGILPLTGETTMNRLGIILLVSGLLAACATSSGLGTAASRLDSSAHRFYEQLDSSSYSGHSADDAARLAEAARDFNREVDYSRSREELRPSFERLAERYHHLRRQVDDGDPMYRRQSVAFERVTEAYLDVDRAMNHPDSRYHDDRYRDDHRDDYYRE